MSEIEFKIRRPGGGAPAGKWIEYPDIDVRVLLQVHEAPVLARGVEVVDEHAHAHAAIRGAAHVLQQNSRGLVLVNDVVLNVERALGAVGERDQAVEGLLSRGEQPDAGQVARIVVLACEGDAAEGGGLR